MAECGGFNSVVMESSLEEILPAMLEIYKMAVKMSSVPPRHLHTLLP